MLHLIKVDKAKEIIAKGNKSLTGREMEKGPARWVEQGEKE